MVNPAKDETARIRLLLERFGAVRDANVFYWFQNRRSRSRRRARQLQQSCGGTGDADQLPSNAVLAGHGYHGIGTPPYNAMQYGQLCGGVPAAAVTAAPHFLVDDADSGDDLFAIPRQMGLMARGGESQHSYTATDASQLSYQATVPGTTMPVFINGTVYDVPSTGALDVAGTFGSDVILVHSSGEILPVNERGVLMKSLQMGECYYLVIN
ncbi:WUSCHEL-related homeobox 10 [Hordeum vulgare]|nr:WUSCHEL-related homeobox 10 [Hordeum vulgare]